MYNLEGLTNSGSSNERVLRIRNLRCEQTASNRYKVSCDAERYCESFEIWYHFEVQGTENLSPCVSYDPFFLPSLLICMKSGENLIIEGEISRRLAFSVWNGLQIVLLEQIPGLQAVSFDAQLTNRVPGKTPGAVTGLSLGVDSLTVIERFLFSDHDNDYSLKCFIFNDVGSHGSIETGKVYLRRRQDAINFCKNFDLPIVFIKSNIDQLIPISFEETHSIRNFSAALLLQSNFDKFYYASGLHYKSMRLGPFRDMAYADAFLFPLLSTEAFSAFVVGTDLTRVEKTFLITKNPESQNILDVCVTPHLAHNFKNCSKCKKCLRTMLTLEMLGKLNLYSKVFDINEYKVHKKQFFIYLFSEDHDLYKEIIEYAKKNHYQFNLGKLEFMALKMRAAVRKMHWKIRMRIPQGIKIFLRSALNHTIRIFSRPVCQ